jgi:hypothetical protein
VTSFITELHDMLQTYHGMFVLRMMYFFQLILIHHGTSHEVIWMGHDNVTARDDIKHTTILFVFSAS